MPSAAALLAPEVVAQPWRAVAGAPHPALGIRSTTSSLDRSTRPEPYHRLQSALGHRGLQVRWKFAAAEPAKKTSGIACGTTTIKEGSPDGLTRRLSSDQLVRHGLVRHWALFTFSPSCQAVPHQSFGDPKNGTILKQDGLETAILIKGTDPLNAAFQGRASVAAGLDRRLADWNGRPAWHGKTSQGPIELVDRQAACHGRQGGARRWAQGGLRFQGFSRGGGSRSPRGGKRLEIPPAPAADFKKAAKA